MGQSPEAGGSSESSRVGNVDSLAHGRSPAGPPALDVTALQTKADQGDANAQYHLGVLCHRASVDPLRGDKAQFRLEAYVWLRLAAAQHFEDSVAAWERVTMTMTRAEIAEGNRRAAGFVARPAPSPPS